MSTGLLSWRTLTACLVIAACGFTAYRGWQITSLVRVIDARGAVVEERDRLGAFADAFGVGHFALTELRRLPAEPGPPQDQAADPRLRLTELILSHMPLSSVNWLELCNRRLAAGQKFERVVQAFVLSGLTGRNEGYVMYRRTQVGIALWSALPEDAKRITMNDLAQTLSEMPGEEIARIKQALSGQDESMRSEFRSRLAGAGVSSDPALRKIGL